MDRFLPLPPLLEEEEEEDRAYEPLFGDTGRPTLITVPFEADELGREPSDGQLIRPDSGSFGRLDFVILLEDCFLAVRPPEGSMVRDGVVSCTAAVRTQRSGAAYWYASMSLTFAGGNRVSRASNCPKKML